MEQNLTLEDLMINDLKIYQNKQLYNFTSDATILAEFVKLKKNDKIVEACSGSGVISVLLTSKGAKNITCFEIQPQMADMSKKTVEYNNLCEKIKIVCDDFKNAKNYVNDVDIVVCNPPYFKAGKQSETQHNLISKFETTMSLEQLVETSSKILKSKGKFFICFSPSRTCELLCLLEKNKLQPKTIFFTQKDQTKEPSCVFVECVKDGNSGIKVLPVLFTHDCDGKFVLSTAKLFEKYKNIL